MKEARRLTNCWTAGDRTVDSVDMLRHEYAVLRRLEGLDFVPRPVDLFREWEHTFLVEERVEGIAFHDFWAQDDVILAPYIRREGRVERFVPRFREVAGRLIRMIEEVHARGVVLGDLSPNNILIDTETLRMRFIDFESAVHADDEAALLAYGTRWGTPDSSTRTAPPATGCSPATTGTPRPCSSTAASCPPPRSSPSTPWRRTSSSTNSSPWVSPSG